MPGDNGSAIDSYAAMAYGVAVWFITQGARRGKYEYQVFERPAGKVVCGGYANSLLDAIGAAHKARRNLYLGRKH